MTARSVAASRPLALARCGLIALFFGATALAGCGKTGELEQPAPMFGAHAKADYAAKKKAEAEARAREDAARKARPAPATVVEDPTNEPLTQAPYTPAIPNPTGNPRGGQPASSLGDASTTPHS